MPEQEFSLTPKQYDTLARLQCRITSLTIHPYSGAATVKHRDATMAIIEQDGTVGYAYRFGDGTLAHPITRTR